MRKETFLELLSDIDDDLIDEAEKVQKKQHRYIMKYLSTAACICIVLGGFIVGSFIEHSEEKVVRTSSIKSTQKEVEVKEENMLSSDECKIDNTENKNKQFKGKKNTQDEGSQKDKMSSNNTESADTNNLYNGEGTGEFIFNKKRYRIVNSTEYLMTNSLPIQIGASDVGTNLANNVCDTANNNIGNVYEYKNMNNQGILIVEDINGIYNLAVEK